MGEGNLLQERNDENPGNFLASLAWCNAVYVGVCVCVCVCVCNYVRCNYIQIHLMSLSGPEHVNYAKVPFHDLKGMLFI